MAKPVRITLASIGVLLALVAVLLAAQTATSTYLLPSPTPGTATRHTAVFGPGVAATVLAAVLALVCVGWLARNIVGVPRRRMWLIPVGALLVSYLVLFAVLGMDHPVF